MSMFVRVVLVSVVASVAPAQERVPDGSRLLERCVASMRALPSVTFRTTEVTASPIARMLRQRVQARAGAGPAGPAEVVVDGGWDAELRWAEVADGDAMVFCGERALVRDGDGPWRPRRGVGTNGEPMPFVFDPALFFDLLARVPADERGPVRQQVADWEQRPVALLGLSLEGEAALDLVLGGGLPAGAGGSSGGGLVVLAAGVAGAAPQIPAPELKLDLALWVDPVDGHAQRVRARVLRRGGGAAGAVRVQLGAGEPADDEVEEFDADGNRRFEDGLPVRRVPADATEVVFDVRLTDHGAATPPELDAEAAAHLRRTRAPK